MATIERRLGAAATLLAILLGSPAEAAGPVLPEELAVTDSIVVQDWDELQVDFLSRYQKLGSAKALTLEAELEYGLTDRLQVRAGAPYELRFPSHGDASGELGEAEIGVRYALLDFRTPPLALDLGLRLGLPTGNGESGEGDQGVSLAPSFTASRWLGRVSAQMSFAWQRSNLAGAASANEFDYDIAFLYPVREWWLVAEGAGKTAQGELFYSLVPELIWKPVKDFELLLAFPVGVTRAAPDYGIIAGVTFEFENLFGRGAETDRGGS